MQGARLTATVVWWEEGYHLQRFNNGQAAKRTEIYTNLAAEWWSTVGQPIERRAVIIPNDEKLVAQLTSRRKQYDSKGREKLESKADLRARGVESPDRADALIGAIILGQESQIDWKAALAFQKEIKHRMHLDYLRTGRGSIHFFLNHRPFLSSQNDKKHCIPCCFLIV